MRIKIVYLLLTVIGALVPYIFFLPWLLEHGLNLPLLFQELHASRVSEFFAADVILSATVVLVFLYFERRRLGRSWWVPVSALLVCGVSAGLPVLLYCREARLKVRV